MNQEQPKTIDLTPRGCQTPEGNARVAKALDEWNASAHQVANLAAQFLDDAGPYLKFPAEDFGEAFGELETAITDRAAKQEEFLRAMAGVPTATAEAAGEERTRIGNTPDQDDDADIHEGQPPYDEDQDDELTRARVEDLRQQNDATL